MAAKEKSLLEKALMTENNRVSKLKINDEDIELAIAWLWVK